MATAGKMDVGAVEKRQPPWKRRLTIGDLAVAIALLAGDLGLLRTTFGNPILSSILLLALLALMVGFVWRYVPRGWDRLGFVVALVLYLLFLAFFVVVSQPILIQAWMTGG
jgi:hypothetical protein